MVPSPSTYRNLKSIRQSLYNRGYEVVLFSFSVLFLLPHPRSFVPQVCPLFDSPKRPPRLLWGPNVDASSHVLSHLPTSRGTPYKSSFFFFTFWCTTSIFVPLTYTCRLCRKRRRSESSSRDCTEDSLYSTF